MELSIEGSFYAVMSFMKKLEDGDRFTLPANFLIQTKQTGLVARLNLLIFTFGNPVRTAPAPSPAPAPQPPGLPGLPAVQ